jgi:hypothetical protein
MIDLLANSGSIGACSYPRQEYIIDRKMARGFKVDSKWIQSVDADQL